MKSALCLIALVLACQSTSIMSIFDDVQDQYGKTLVANIQIQLESGEQVDVITDQMRDVNNDLKQQLADGEAHHNAQRESCANDMAELSSFHSQAQADAAKFAGMADLDSSTLASRQQELANKLNEMTQREATVASLESQRADEQERFAGLLAEHEQVFGALATVRQIINDRFRAEGEFLQAGSSMESQIVSKLRSFKTADKGVAHGYNSFLQLLAKIVAKSEDVHTDQVIIDNILSVVQRIEDNLEMSLASERDAERQRSEDHAMLMAKMGGIINDLQGAINDLNSVIFTLQSRVQANNEKVQNAQASVNDFAARLNDRNAECSAQQAVWENFYNNITAELSTAAKLMYVLTDKRALLARYGL